MVQQRMSSTKVFKPLTQASFDDPKVFSNRSTSKLLFTYAILRSCAIDPLVVAGTTILNLLEKVNMAKPAHWVVEKTYFAHFVAGKNLRESLNRAAELSNSGLNTILDYSIESADGNIDEVCDVLVEAIRQSGQRNYTPFSCFKISALASHHLLMRINEILEYGRSNPTYEGALELQAMVESPNLPEYVSNLILKKRQPNEPPALRADTLPEPWSTKGAAPPALTAQELERFFVPFARRLERLGNASREHDQKLLIDAEQSWFQEAITFASRCMMVRHNQEKPLVYNTYQMYLKAAPQRLAEDIAYMQEKGLMMGAKIVRGAYMGAEAEWAKAHDRENPNFTTIEDTHAAYNAAINTMLDLAKQGRGAVVIASHNEKSMLAGSQGLYERDMPPNHPHVHFGQLYGMCDHMSLALSHNGHNIVKYVPFGPVAEVMPYLLRRVSENRGFLASTKKEQGLMLAELKSRFFGTKREKCPTHSSSKL